jgi:hypothetical protein
MQTWRKQLENIALPIVSELAANRRLIRRLAGC